MNPENQITKAKNILVLLPGSKQETNEFKQLIENFCGTVVNEMPELQAKQKPKRIYVCGDISQLEAPHSDLFIIKELSQNYENRAKDNQIIGLGEVPIIVSKAGVYFRQFFKGNDYFNKIKNEHEFQHLTESNKPGKALRKGIYLTEVRREETAEKAEQLHFRLLRCSSNLTGPTDNFRETDAAIIQALNKAAQSVFEQAPNLNHVLAQIYENKKKTGPKVKELKAKIKAHSDKTKDMTDQALIAFCTFYDEATFQALKPSKTDSYDWCYKKTSGLTRLHFKLKKTVDDDRLNKEFTVILYPNSVFFIPLSTNRLYTHEIRPSVLNIDRIPTRMGYVVRCSKAEAVFMNEQTYIKENGALVKLEQMTDGSMNDLRDTYYEENKTENKVKYGKVHFSMNTGDYQKPIY